MTKVHDTTKVHGQAARGATPASAETPTVAEVPASFAAATPATRPLARPVAPRKVATTPMVPIKVSSTRAIVPAPVAKASSRRDNTETASSSADVRPVAVEPVEVEPVEVEPVEVEPVEVEPVDVETRQASPADGSTDTDTPPSRTSRTEIPGADLRFHLVEPVASPVAASRSRWSRRLISGVLVALVALAVVVLALSSLLNRAPEPSSTGDASLPSLSGAASAPDSGAASAPASLAPSGSTSVPAPTPVVVGGSDVSAAATFLAANTNPGTRLLVPPDLVGPLSAALPGRALVTDAAASAEAPDLVVSRGALPAGIATTPVARFGSLRVAQIMPTALAATDELDARRSAGSQLVSNAALRVTDQARTALRSGGVDPRLMLVLAGLLIDHDVSVDVVAPDSSSEPASARRSLKVVDIDGGPASDLVAAFVNAQGRELLPQSLTTVDSGRSVVLHYPVPSPVGLLAGAGFATASP